MLDKVRLFKTTPEALIKKPISYNTALLPKIEIFLFKLIILTPKPEKSPKNIKSLKGTSDNKTPPLSKKLKKVELVTKLFIPVTLRIADALLFSNPPVSSIYLARIS